MTNFSVTVPLCRWVFCIRVYVHCHTIISKTYAWKQIKILMYNSCNPLSLRRILGKAMNTIVKAYDWREFKESHNSLKQSVSSSKWEAFGLLRCHKLVTRLFHLNKVQTTRYQSLIYRQPSLTSVNRGLAAWISSVYAWVRHKGCRAQLTFYLNLWLRLN